MLMVSVDLCKTQSETRIYRLLNLRVEIVSHSLQMSTLFTASKRHNFRFQENLYTDLAWAHKNVGRAQALVGQGRPSVLWSTALRVSW